MPKITKLEIEGQGYHTNAYSIHGIYFGGKEGRSRVQWFRAMAGSPDLIPIAGKIPIWIWERVREWQWEVWHCGYLFYVTYTGEVGRTYEAHVDDVGYRLVAIYTAVREDGVEGAPVSASTEPIAVGMPINAYQTYSQNQIWVMSNNSHESPWRKFIKSLNKYRILIGWYHHHMSKFSVSTGDVLTITSCILQFSSFSRLAWPCLLNTRTWDREGGERKVGGWHGEIWGELKWTQVNWIPFVSCSFVDILKGSFLVF